MLNPTPPFVPYAPHALEDRIVASIVISTIIVSIATLTLALLPTTYHAFSLTGRIALITAGASAAAITVAVGTTWLVLHGNDFADLFIKKNNKQLYRDPRSNLDWAINTDKYTNIKNILYICPDACSNMDPKVLSRALWLAINKNDKDLIELLIGKQSQHPKRYITDPILKEAKEKKPRNTRYIK